MKNMFTIKFNYRVNKSVARTAAHCLVAATLVTGLTACDASKKVTELAAAAAQDSVPAVPTDASVTDVTDVADTSTGSPGTGDTPEGPETDSSETPPETDTVPDTIAALSNTELLLGAPNVSCEADAELFKQTMIAVTNESRMVVRACGDMTAAVVPTVSWNENLAQAALSHARDMTTNNFFDHTGSDGLGVSERATAAGYQWRAIGENIAAGQLDVGEVHQGWVDSPGHCLNIMSELYTEMGAACLSDPNTEYGSYWVVVFGDAR